MQAGRRHERLNRRRFLTLAAASTLATTGTRASGGQVPAPQAADLPLEDRLRDLAENAALTMRFEGSTAAECREWQSRFSLALKALLGPCDPPREWKCELERTVALDDHVREERLLTAKGVAPLPLHLLLPHGKANEAPGQVKHPGILAIHGHGPLGYDAVVDKAETSEAKAEIASTHYDYGRKL
ncbi:MAG TPA: hypothetical protein VGY53_01985, partial [Isosphaeraceae bacterium]|nr:hypothetical protein [Isosphaeraceae bacterium]